MIIFRILSRVLVNTDRNMAKTYNSLKFVVRFCSHNILCHSRLLYSGHVDMADRRLKADKKKKEKKDKQELFVFEGWRLHENNIKNRQLDGANSS